MPPRSAPHYDLERAHGNLVAGVDEAGRGPWAGPVVASAVILDIQRIPDGINDSKKLRRSQREALFEHITQSAHVGVGIASVEEIDALNILQATKLAMRRAVEALPITPQFALIDGNQNVALPCPSRTVVEGDAVSLSIAAASIIAKVTRDRIMAQLHETFPHYGFATNMGYGTQAHQRGLAEYGVTPHHRRSFAPIRALLEMRAQEPV